MRQLSLVTVSVLVVITILISACRGWFSVHDGSEDAQGDPPGADARADGRTADSGQLDGPDVVAQACPGVDADTLALYTFDNDNAAIVTDSVGEHDGMLHDAPMTPVIPGPQGCGNGMSFPLGDMVHAEIPDSNAWDLAVGSIDLWVMPTAETGSANYRGIISRDASGTMLPGHMTLFQWNVAGEQILVARFQITIDDGLGMYWCSEPVTPGIWTHVGINFGSPGVELWIDGVQTSNMDPFDSGNGVVDCNQPDVIRHIDGNNNPWAFGVDSGGSPEGMLANPREPLVGGAIDHVRISSERRDFRVYSTL